MFAYILKTWWFTRLRKTVFTLIIKRDFSKKNTSVYSRNLENIVSKVKQYHLVKRGTWSYIARCGGQSKHINNGPHYIQSSICGYNCWRLDCDWHIVEVEKVCARRTGNEIIDGALVLRFGTNADFKTALGAKTCAVTVQAFGWTQEVYLKNNSRLRKDEKTCYEYSTFGYFLFLVVCSANCRYYKGFKRIMKCFPFVETLIQHVLD